MTESHGCQSCTMPIESGEYCRYCAPDGQLIEFDECLQRMMQWTMRHHPEYGRDRAEEETRNFMRTMPAWKDHPSLQS